MTKVKFVANYDSDQNIYNSILNCFPMSKQEKEMLTDKDDYDYLGIFNGYQQKKIKTPRSKNIGFLQEPIGNINYDRNLHYYCGKIFCQSEDMFDKKSSVETNLHMFYSNHTKTHHSHFDNSSFNKSKKICIFVSGISSPNNRKWKNHNYTKRINLVKAILKSDLDIDIYGRGLRIEDPRYKGSPDNKHEILKQYEYSIAVENCCERNYVSEKFFDCILNNVVPIYYGSSSVDQIFNKDCHTKIDIEKEYIIENIKSIIAKDTKSYQESILCAKKDYYSKFNPLKRIIDEVSY